MAQIKLRTSFKINQNKERSRNISDTTNIRKRLAKLEMNRFIIPFRFRPERREEVKKVREDVEEDEGRNQFKEWDHVDIYASKHGIEEYTIQQENQQEEEDEEETVSVTKRSVSSKKKRHRRISPKHRQH